MAHIERRGKNLWRARYRAPDGKERSQTFCRRSDAEDWLSDVESAKRRGLWVDPALGKQTLEAWSRKWLETVRPTLKPATAQLYESLLRSRILPALGDHRLAALRPSDIQGFVGSMQTDGLSASRTRHCLVVLRSILDAAVRDRMLAVNPCYGVKAPRIQRREAAYFEPAVVDRVIAAAPEPYDFLMRVLGVGGLRFGEAAALRRSSVLT
jgi:site-specific recombinase XerC